MTDVDTFFFALMLCRASVYAQEGMACRYAAEFLDRRNAEIPAWLTGPAMAGTVWARVLERAARLWTPTFVVEASP